MESISLVNTMLLFGSLLILIGIFSSLVASRFSAPLLLVFLGIGMLAGEDGIGGIQFDNYQVAYLIGSCALAVIIFDGGLRTRFSVFKSVLAPSMTLSTLGVVMTAALLAVPAVYLFDFTPLEGLLMGSIVASTDAAAVFFLLKAGGLRLRHKVGSTLEIESATNDPIAVFLTIVLVQLIAAGADPSLSVLSTLFQQAFFGGLFGFIGGYTALYLLNRVNLPGGLHPLFVVAFALMVFSVTAKLNGSGFLAVYIAGLVLGNNPVRAFPSIIKFHDAMTWLSQIIMFIMLGLLVNPSDLLRYAPIAIEFALFLIFIARPVAIWLCLIPFKFSAREKTFVSWVGLRGAVSIFLAAIPMLSGLPHAEIYFNVAFFAVIVSLVLQGWTINTAARGLKVALPSGGPQVNRVELDLPGQTTFELAGYSIAPDSDILSHGVIPSWATLTLVVRAGDIIKGSQAGALRAGDYAYFLVRPEQVQRLDRLFVSSDDLALGTRSIFQKISVDGEATLSQLVEQHGVKIHSDQKTLSVTEIFAKNVEKTQEAGDRIALTSGILIARKVMDGKVVKADLLIEGASERRGGIELIQLISVFIRKEIFNFRSFLRRKNAE